MKIVKKIINKSYSQLKSILNKNKFQKALIDKVPLAFHDVAKFSYQKKLRSDDKSLGQLVESFRQKIVSDHQGKKIETFGSPHSKSELFDEKGKIKPGDYGPRPAEGVARTGTAIFGGLQLKKIVESIGGGRVIELGTNTGLSGCYFLSSNMPVELVTIEGSEKLCKIAEKNLINISNNFQVLNQMFDDALSDLINKKEEFDIGFVDGQHEKKATLFYARELKKIVKPGGIIIFDDIYWSEDMNNGWNDLIKDKDFSATIDLGNRGICVLDKEEETKKHFCLGDYIGNPLIYRSGW